MLKKYKRHAYVASHNFVTISIFFKYIMDLERFWKDKSVNFNESNVQNLIILKLNKFFS